MENRLVDYMVWKFAHNIIQVQDDSAEVTIAGRELIIAQDIMSDNFFTGGLPVSRHLNGATISMRHRLR